MRSGPGFAPDLGEERPRGRLRRVGRAEVGPVRCASSSAALSRTERETTPCALIPLQPSPASGPAGVRPRVGFMPNTPQHEAGTRIEPPPSVACAAGTMPAATAAAEPPDEPPAPRSGCHGFRVWPNRRDSERGGEAELGRVRLAEGHEPRAPEARRRSRSRAAGTKSAKSREPWVSAHARHRGVQVLQQERHAARAARPAGPPRSRAARARASGSPRRSAPGSASRAARSRRRAARSASPRRSSPARRGRARRSSRSRPSMLPSGQPRGSIAGRRSPRCSTS